MRDIKITINTKPLDDSIADSPRDEEIIDECRRVLMKKIAGNYPRYGKSIAPAPCPHCNTNMGICEDYGEIVIYYCPNCKKKVKAKRMRMEFKEKANDELLCSLLPLERRRYLNER